MNTEYQLKSLSDELQEIKVAYEQASQNLIMYEYSVDVEYDPDIMFVLAEIIFRTEDGSNALVTIEGADFERLPYEGGARLFLGRKLDNDPIKLYAFQKGNITYDN